MSRDAAETGAWAGGGAQAIEGFGGVVEAYGAVAVEIGGGGGAAPGFEDRGHVVEAHSAVVVDIGIAGIAEAVAIGVELAGVGGFEAVVTRVHRPIEITIPEGVDVEGCCRGRGLCGLRGSGDRRDRHLAVAGVYARGVVLVGTGVVGTAAAAAIALYI